MKNTLIFINFQESWVKCKAVKKLTLSANLAFHIFKGSILGSNSGSILGSKSLVWQAVEVRRLIWG